MKTTAKTFLAWAMAALFLAGCGGSADTPDSTGADDTAPTYTNLVDTATQKEVAAALQEHGVTKSQTDTLLDWANDFNSRVTSSPLPEGFHEMAKEGNDYSSVLIRSNEASDGFLYPEANCRLTSFLLMKNLLQTNKAADPSDTFLMFDIDAIDTYQPFQLTQVEKADFLSLFNWVPLKGAVTMQEHIQRIQQVWKDHGIRIGGEDISLITVYLHSPFEDVRFVGHTGVLLEQDGGLLFLEKYGPQAPFQATRFRDRQELKYYLLSRADLYGDSTELDPIIMENDQVL